MNAQELLSELLRNGVIISSVGNELRIDAPKGVLMAELRQALAEQKQAILTLLSATPIAAAPIVQNQREIDAPPRRLYMDAEREEIIAEILRLERKHIQEGLHYDRVRYLDDNTLNRRKEFLLDYLYSLCDHLGNYQIGVHDLAERQAIREYEGEVEQKLRLQQKPKVEIFPDRRILTTQSVPSGNILTFYRRGKRHDSEH